MQDDYLRMLKYHDDSGHCLSLLERAGKAGVHFLQGLLAVHLGLLIR